MIFSFTYLGLIMGANPRVEATLDPLINLIFRILITRHHKYISLGRRMILLSFVLNSIIVFYLFPLKMLVKEWKKIVRI